MALTSGVLPDDVASSELQAQNLSQCRPSPTVLPEQRIRRKSSLSFRSGSSEDYPSPHDSIYEAVYISAASSEDNGQKIQLITIPPRNQTSSPTVGRGHDENTREIHTTFDAQAVHDVEFLYGHGTPLETITEQKSFATISTLTRTRSTDDLTSLPFLRHRDSFVLGRSPRRKQSFSLDDLALVDRTYHDACAMIEREIHRPLPIHEVYAEPKTPIHAPPYRPGTPPGMPSWTAAQNTPRPRNDLQQPKQNRLQRWLGLPGSEAVHSSRILSSPLHRTMSNSGRQAPKFRPPRSVYGPLEQHPFVKAINSQTAGPSRIHSRRINMSSSHGGRGAEGGPSRPSAISRLTRRVRFTPSATARDSEMVLVPNTMEATSSTGVNPMTPVQSGSTRISPKPKQCPHRKGRIAALNALKHSQSQLSTISFNQDTSVLIAPSTDNGSPSSAQSSLTQPISGLSSRHVSLNEADMDLEHTRSLSISSTAHLTSGAVDHSLHPIPEVKGKVKDHVCWKCKAEAFFAKVDRLWVRSASCLCFVCCGFDIEDGSTVPHGYASVGSGFSPSPTRMRGCGSARDRRVPRMVYVLHDPSIDMV